jgi:hypothetical protein
LFLPESAWPLMIDRLQYRRSWTSLPLSEILIGRCRLPPPHLVVKHASLIPKESIDSGTHSEPLQRIDSMENVNLGVEELADFCWCHLSDLSCRRRHHSCMQHFLMSADSCLRDMRTHVIQYSSGQATNYMVESVHPDPVPSESYPTPSPSPTSHGIHYHSFTATMKALVMCKEGIDAGLLGTRSAVNGLWRL